MQPRGSLRCVFLGLVLLPIGWVRAADAPATGFQSEVSVGASTRLDWAFACAGFGAEAAQLPRDYASTSQRYQLYVPRGYDREKAWPLVLFISPGDDPMGWRYWQKICEDNGYLFCAAYGAGNNCPAGKRTRIVLDAFDDVRRHYRIDPDQTLLSGFSGGGRMACTIAFSLPEFFGGIVPICGTNPLPGASYLRHRILDRLSVAFVTGDTDFNRKENEDYMAPMFADLGIRSKLWVAPKSGHAVPSEKVLAEVHAWIADDLKRRQQDRKDHPLLTVKPDEAPTREQLAQRLLEAGQAELKTPQRTWRGVALLQGAVLRGENTDAVPKARKILETLPDDPRIAALIEDQGGSEERLTLLSQAKAFERMGEPKLAIKAWQLLSANHPSSKEGKQAAGEIERLKAGPADKTYLGVSFEEGALTVAEVQKDSPAAKAGLKAGDRLLMCGKAKLASAQDVARAIASQRPGDKVVIELERGGKNMKVTVELGTMPKEN
jgi:predicted esterase